MNKAVWGLYRVLLNSADPRVDVHTPLTTHPGRRRSFFVTRAPRPPPPRCSREHQRSAHSRTAYTLARATRHTALAACGAGRAVRRIADQSNHAETLYRPRGNTQHTHGGYNANTEVASVKPYPPPFSSPRRGRRASVARAVGFSREVGDEPDKVADRDGRRDAHGEDAGVVVVPGRSKGGEIGGCVGGGLLEHPRQWLGAQGSDLSPFRSGQRCQTDPEEARGLTSDTGVTLVMLSGGLLQHQITPQAASGSGEPWPTSRSGGAGPAISGVFSTCCRASSWPGTPPSAWHPPRPASPG